MGSYVVRNNLSNQGSNTNYVDQTKYAYVLWPKDYLFVSELAELKKEKRLMSAGLENKKGSQKQRKGTEKALSN